MRAGLLVLFTAILNVILSAPVEAQGNLPTSFDLRDVNGGNYITPLKTQGSLGLCWAFATVEQVESLLMVTSETPYDEETTEVFSVRQMDYATSKDGILEYNNDDNYTNRELTSGGNFYMASLALVNGLTLVDDTMMPYGIYADGKELAEVLSYENSRYEVNGTMMVQNSETMVETIKAGVMSYGGAYVGTGSPTGACGARNADGFYVIDEDSDCRSTSAYGGHAMQVIGWDDDYEYQYCKDGNTHKMATGGSCSQGMLVNGRGAWLVRNSWGEASAQKYIYLSFDSVDASYAFVTSVSKMSERTWDNNYHETPFYTALADYSDEIEITKKINTAEKIEKIKFMTMSEGGEFTVVVKDGETVVGAKTVQTNAQGYYTIDFSDMVVMVNGEDFTVAVSGDGYLLVDSLAVFTSNVDKTPVVRMPEIVSEAGLIETSDFSKRVLMSTKNIPSGEELTFSLSLGGVDKTEYLTVTNAEVAINNANVVVGVDKAAGYGHYVLTANYGGESFETKLDLKPEGVVGDLTGDTNVSSADYVKVRKHIMGTGVIDDSRLTYLADVNGDGRITSADYVKIRKYIMNGGEW